MVATAAAPASLAPARRPDLIVPPAGNGPYVVKDPTSGAYYHLGDEEHFLLMQLDGTQSADAIASAFGERFGELLSPEDIDDFVELARRQGFVQDEQSISAPRPRQSILYWRKNFFDPDRLFNWLEPRLWFCWTRGFLIFSAGFILTAAFVLWANRGEAAGSLVSALRWETAFWAWLMLFVVTMLHECAHGLTCKRYGGEVHEIGFLLMFFMPCFYCNVSDAWLFKEKSKRLWVMFAGGYFEIFLWSLAVFTWRLTVPDSLLNYLAFVVLTSCGVQSLFNFNPLLKLDGYYLLSDWLEVPNLRQRAIEQFKGQLRRLLWGAARPEDEPRGRLLLGFGLVSWLYSVVFVSLMLWAMFQFAWKDWGWLGAMGVVLLGFVSTRGLFQGVAAREVHTMITKRRRRTLVWLAGVSALAAVFCFVQMEDRVGGTFRLRPAARAELRAPLAGFLKEVYFDEGERVSPGVMVARLEVLDLESRLTQKRAEVAEVQASLRLLQIGPRPEEVAEQVQRVERNKAWRDLAGQDLKRTQQALDEDLYRLEKQIAARRAELDAAENSFQRAKLLVDRKVLTKEQYHEVEGRSRISEAHLAEAQAARRAHQAKGTIEAEAELARREKELADAQAVLRLLEAGTRPEEIQSEQARLARLQEEVRHLEEQQRKQSVTVPLSGVIVTSRLKEKVGQYLREGELICVVEELQCMEAEIALGEHYVAQVRPEQKVQLKVRALPFESFATRLDRVAPAAGRGEAGKGDQPSVITAYCQIDHPPADLRSEMTGYARIYTGRRPIGEILLDRAIRFIRTEFWW